MHYKKDRVALKPPLGWNSWDCYGPAVNEVQLLGNARYIAEHLKAHGWQYVVCYIQWYEPEAGQRHWEYNRFAELCMDGFGRLIPAENRFPSAANGAGFKPIADQIHALGLKFGIHIMRGVPRLAVHRALPVKGTLMQTPSARGTPICTALTLIVTAHKRTTTLSLSSTLHGASITSRSMTSAT